LVEDEQVVACICGFFSGETLATGAMFDEAGLLMASTGTNRNVDEEGFDTWFRALAAEPAQGAATAHYIVDTLQAESVSVVHDNQDYSKALAKDVAAAIGDRLDGLFVINPEESNHSAVVAQVKRRNPDVVYYGGYYQQAGALLRQLRQAGVRSVFATDDGALFPGIRRYLRGLRGAARLKAACPCSDPTEIEGAAAFVDEYRASFGKRPRIYSADAFDVTNIAIDALRGLAGTESLEQARAHVVSHFDAADGVEGTVKDYTWNERGELVADESDVFVWKWLDSAQRYEYVGRVSELTGSS
jgi:branched-chain amino acid transport system substrate-binding protein